MFVWRVYWISSTLTFLSTEWHLATGIRDVTFYLILQTGKLEKSSMPQTALSVLQAGVKLLCPNPSNYFVCSRMSGLYDGTWISLFFSVFLWGCAFGSILLEKLSRDVSKAIPQRNSSLVWCFQRGPQTRLFKCWRAVSCLPSSLPSQSGGLWTK